MFGGGYSMLPVLEHEMIDNKKWLTNEEIIDLYALAQCTPGVIAVNTATKVGYKIKGVTGAFFATVGVVMPSFFIIILISLFLDSFSYIEAIQNILIGIRIASCAMMANTLIKLMKAGIKNQFGIAVFIFSAMAVILFKFSVVWVIILDICLGIVYGKIRGSHNDS